jgi:hypothetical protein
VNSKKSLPEKFLIDNVEIEDEIENEGVNTLANNGYDDNAS